jgi:hypothetical protein
MRCLVRLEALKPARPFRVFRSMEQDDDAFEAWKTNLLTSGEAHEEDMFIRVVFVSPPFREETRPGEVR